MVEIYHVYNRSIGEIEVFKANCEYLRIINTIRYYQVEKPPIKFSLWTKQEFHLRGGIDWNSILDGKNRLVEILAYCIMPTHFHLLLEQIKEGGISTFSSNVLNSYTRCFNTKYNRKGTLWEGKTKRVLAKTDEQLLHLTRYIHLNPVTAHLVEKPEEWPYSSYHEYISKVELEDRICSYKKFFPEMSIAEYKKFTEDGIAYQRELAKIKNGHSTSEVELCPPRRWNY